jgi:hypothetical protein
VRAGEEEALAPGDTPIRLTPGSHSSPREGVCVVELASIIARERFTDHPRCVCPVVGAFLRGFNDRAPYAERQRLAPYAARIVGSRSTRRVTNERRDLCLAWSGAEPGRGTARRLAARIAMRLRIAVFCGLGPALRSREGAGQYASRALSARRDSDGAFELLEALLAIGSRGPSGAPPSATRDNGHRPASRADRPMTASPNGRPAPAGNGSAPTGAAPAADPAPGQSPARQPAG